MWLTLVFVIVVLIYIKYIKPLHYWKEKGIPYQKPMPVFGNMLPVAIKKQPFFKVVQDFYKAFPEERYNGIHRFTKPVLIIRDLDLIKQITIKDFEYFTDHNPFITEDVDVLAGKTLFLLKGQRWHDMRVTLSPSFTGSKIKIMFPLIRDCCKRFIKHFQNQSTEVINVEIKNIFTRYTNDLIASVVFGLDVDSLKEQNNEFYLMGKDAVDLSGFAKSLKIVLINLSSTLSKLLGLKFFPANVSEFFRSIIKETIRQREKEGLVRPDIIHLLMEARKSQSKQTSLNGNPGDTDFDIIEDFEEGKVQKRKQLQLTDDDITAQALTFFTGGFETSASFLFFATYELAVNPDIQKKLQVEIDQTFTNCKGNIAYEALLGMRYLDMVASETLRKWPPSLQIDRMCVKEYTIQPKKQNEKPFTIEEGQVIFVPIAGLHHDPKYFPNPDKFDPERFSEENKFNIELSAYMPFGLGQRSCIASRFALLQNKTLVCQLLRNFDIVPIKETMIPLKMDGNMFNVMPDKGAWLGLRKRKI